MPHQKKTAIKIPSEFMRLSHSACQMFYTLSFIFNVLRELFSGQECLMLYVAGSE